MNVWIVKPRCSICHVRQIGLRHNHKFGCYWSRWTSYALPQRDPGRSIHRPWLAKWPTEWRREKK